MTVIDRRGAVVGATNPPSALSPNPDLAIKTPCACATTANITLSGLQTIDGYTPVDGDRVLVKNQTDQTANGIYSASTGNWTRTSDTDVNSQWSDGLKVYVIFGTLNGALDFVCTTANPITLGTSNITFVKYQVSALSGITYPAAPYAVGDLLYADSTTSMARVAGNTTTTKKYLSQTGDGAISAAPAWAAIAQADITGLKTSDAPIFAGITIRDGSNYAISSGIFGGVPSTTFGALGYQGGTVSIVSAINQSTGPGTNLLIVPTITTGNTSVLGALQISQTDSTKLTSNTYLNGVMVQLTTGNIAGNQNAGVLSFVSSKGGADPFGADLHGIIDSAATAAPNYVIGAQATVELNSATHVPAVASAAVLATVESSASKKATALFGMLTSTSAGADYVMKALGTSPMTGRGIYLTPADDLNPTFEAFAITNLAGVVKASIQKSGFGYFQSAGINTSTAGIVLGTEVLGVFGPIGVKTAGTDPGIAIWANYASTGASIILTGYVTSGSTLGLQIKYDATNLAYDTALPAQVWTFSGTEKARLTSGGVLGATQLASSVATGTAPITVNSTTNVANLNASFLNGATFAAPGTIGGGTPGLATFTKVTANAGNGIVGDFRGVGFTINQSGGIQIGSTGGEWLAGLRVVSDGAGVQRTALFYSSSNAGGTTEGLSFSNAGAATFVNDVVISGQLFGPNFATTASAANAFIDTATTPAGQLKRSTSSLRYKRDVEDFDYAVADKLLKLGKPIWYRSAIATDRQDWSFFGLGAEDMAAIDPRFVQWSPIGGKLVPDGIGYDRLTVPLLAIAQNHESRLATLEERLH